MTVRSAHIHELPNAVEEADALYDRIAGRRLAVFLDYDGTLTPIVDRPEDAVISDGMRDAVRRLGRHCTVCVVSGRDRRVVQQLMGLEDLVVAASHGFDIWTPTGGVIQRRVGTGFAGLLADITAHVRSAVADVPGVLIEPKRSSVAVHYRLVEERARPVVEAVVDGVLADHPEELKLTPGKMVYEIQPKVEWDKGRAVLYLLEALGLDDDEVVPLYVGDDVTDEHAFAAIAGRGVGILVADPDDPEVRGRATAADFVLRDPGEVQQLLDRLARRDGASTSLLLYEDFDPAEEGCGRR